MTGSTRIRLRCGLLCLLLTGNLVFGQGRRLSPDNRTASEYEVKAGFLLNFLRFVEWPAATAGDEKDPFSLCILGDDPFRDILDRMVQGETVNGRPIAVRRLSRWQEPCHLLFVSGPARDTLRILRQAGAGVLTVGESSGFLDDGGMINFVVEDRRVRFDVSLENATRASVRISSRLVSVARRVER